MRTDTTAQTDMFTIRAEFSFFLPRAKDELSTIYFLSLLSPSLPIDVKNVFTFVTFLRFFNVFF